MIYFAGYVAIGFLFTLGFYLIIGADEDAFGLGIMIFWLWPFVILFAALCLPIFAAYELVKYFKRVDK